VPGTFNESIRHGFQIKFKKGSQMEFYKSHKGGKIVDTTEKRDFKKEIKSLSQIIAQNPDDMSALQKRAEAFYGVEDFSAAIKDLDEILLKDHNDLSAHNLRGLCHFALKDTTTAIDDFSIAISLEPQTPEFYVNRGVVYLDAGANWQALADINTALSFNRELSIGYYYRGQLMVQMKNVGAAREDFDYAVKLGFEDAQEELDKLDNDDQ